MALDSHIFTLLEPSIKLEEVKTSNLGERVTGDGISDTQGGPEPYLKINEYTFGKGDIDSFILSLNGRYPEMRATIKDTQNFLSIDRFPRDGDLVSLRIQLDEAGTYKDIRMDFTILEFRGQPTTPEASEPPTYNLRGIVKIPGMYTDECKSYGEANSIDHIKQIAKDLKLGLATNITSTNDSMRRFLAYQSKLEFLSDTVLHSYISDDNFQTYSIDPYYYINFVDLQTIFNAPNDIEIHELITNTVFHERGTDPKDGAGQIEADLVLTNHEEVRGTNTFIKYHNLINNSTVIALENGYKRKMQYFDVANNKLVEFDVEAMVSDNIKDNEEPLKGRRNSETDEYGSHIKQKYVGIQSDGLHVNYNFAAINNIQNLVELDKLYLEVELQNVNPALYRYMKIPVTIYNFAPAAMAATKNANEQAKEAGFETQAEDFNQKLEKGRGGASESDKDVLDESRTLDEFLSGHYIIMGIEYRYDSDEGYTQLLKLARREWPARLNNM